MKIKLYGDTNVSNDTKLHEDRWFRMTKATTASHTSPTTLNYNPTVLQPLRQKRDVYRRIGSTRRMQFYLRALWTFVKENNAVTDLEETQG